MWLHLSSISNTSPNHSSTGCPLLLFYLSLGKKKKGMWNAFVLFQCIMQKYDENSEMFVSGRREQVSHSLLCTSSNSYDNTLSMYIV